jgi:uncharacterized protein (TIGR03083 family)
VACYRAPVEQIDGTFGVVSGEAGMGDRVQQLQEETAAARDAVLALVDGLSAADFGRPTVNEGWSVKDTLAHLGSIESRARTVLERGLRGETWTATRADLDAYNAGCVAERRAWTPEAVVAELRETGQETARVLGRLRSEDLDREWQHPLFGVRTIEWTARIIATHLQSHLKDLQTALQR